MSPRIVLWSLISALAGFLFGFDTVVISGAEQTIQSLWSLGPAMHGFAMASALYGTVLGACVGAWPTDRWGRKRTLIVIGVLYFVSAVWSGLAPEVWSLILARVIGGLGVGISTVAAPLYISEISPPARRGLLAGMFQLNVVLGILVAFFSNYLLEDVGEHAWRWMLGVEAIPALLYALLCFCLPESPRWLLARKGDRAGGLEVLRLIQPRASPAELEEAAAAILAASACPAGVAPRFWSRRLKAPILLAFLVAAFNQLSGINAILYFAPRVFELAGLGQKAALLQSIGIGATNLAFTLVGLWLIDRLGRRTLLTIGSFGYLLSLGSCALAFGTESFALVPLCIFAFIAAHAIGQGTVIWVFIAEIFPTHARAAGQALGSLTHWVFAALLTTFFPQMVVSLPPSWVFLFFCGMMALQLLWTRTLMPETKGIPLEVLEKRLGIDS